MFDRSNEVSTPSNTVFSSTGCFPDSSDHVSICCVDAVMRNNAYVCVVMRFVLLKPVKTAVTIASRDIFQHVSLFYCFVPRIRNVYVCGGLGAVRFGVETSDCQNIPSCVIWLSVSENSSLFYVLMTRFPSEIKKKKRRSAALSCPIFLFIVFPEGETGMKNVKAVKVLQKWIILK